VKIRICLPDDLVAQLKALEPEKTLSEIAELALESFVRSQQMGKKIILPENLPSELGSRQGLARMDDLFKSFSLKQAQRIIEKRLITRALESTGGNRTKAVQLLEISHPSLLSKMKTYKIDIDRDGKQNKYSSQKTDG